MPAILDDPEAPTIYRVSGDPPYPDPANPSVPPAITPRHVTLRDRQTVATVVPFASRHQVPESLLVYLCEQFNKEIEGGDTYPMMDPITVDKFASYWFQNFGGIMLLGHIESPADVVEGKDWSKECLGTFYIKPNYPGRSSHICNAGFIVTDASRNRGVGRLMGETYLDWAPKLGYKYSVFNLVYETNVASCKIWDALGFKRIGRVKGAGNLKSHPDRLVDAIIYGRDLGDSPGGPGSDELVSEERFDKIKFYLKTGRYPNGADRAEKSRLRSAATHYKLLDGDILMLKDKEVISDPQRQYEIARSVHNQTHGGINKTTATIAEKYHWSRIKETVSDVIRNCAECKDTSKAAAHASLATSSGSGTGLKRPTPSGASTSASKRASPSPAAGTPMDLTTDSSRPQLSHPTHLSPFNVVPSHAPFSDPTALSFLPPPPHPSVSTATGADMHGPDALSQGTHASMLQAPSHDPFCTPHHASPTHASTLGALEPSPHTAMPLQDYQPIDPAIIAQSSGDSHLHAHHHHHQVYPFTHPSPPPPPSHHQQPHHGAAVPSPPPQNDPEDAEAADAFQALINAGGTDDETDYPTVTVGAGLDSDGSHHHNPGQLSYSIPRHRDPRGAAGARSGEHPQQHAGPDQGTHDDAVDRDLEMLIDAHHVVEYGEPPGGEQQQQGRQDPVFDTKEPLGGGRSDPSKLGRPPDNSTIPTSLPPTALSTTTTTATAGVGGAETHDGYGNIKLPPPVPPPSQHRAVDTDAEMDSSGSKGEPSGGSSGSSRMDLLFYPPPPEELVSPSPTTATAKTTTTMTITPTTMAMATGGGIQGRRLPSSLDGDE
jgi:GNAT superfamily N-acetyltransferase